MKKIHFIIPIAGIVIVLVAAYNVFVLRDTPGESSFASIVSEAQLKALPQKDASGIDTSHLGVGLTAPTNKWFSGIVLQKTPKTVFPTPLSFTPKSDSFTFDLPGVVTNPKGIVAASQRPVQITVEGATRYEVTRYDEVSVDLTYRSADQALGTVTLVAGVPYIFFSGESDVTLRVNDVGKVADDTLTYSLGDITTKVAAYDGAQVRDSRSIKVSKDGLVTMYGGKTAVVKTLDKYAMNRIESTSVTYKKSGDDYRTTIRYNTANDKPTYFGRMPHQQQREYGQTFTTIYGALTVEAGNSLSFTTPQIPVTSSLNLSKLSSEEKRELAQIVRQEINSPHEYPADSYFGGKALYRDSQLLQLAVDLGENEAAATVQARLRSGLLAWLTIDDSAEKSLYYDSKIRGIVGVTPSFGSEEFNDHHFHYGYFIYAASILAQYDTEFRTVQRDQVNLLVADIANYRSGESLPLRRNFDPYFGHSWASGSSPFADGNNQESSSEAINAWIGTELWARQIDNDDLANHAAWMLSNEVAATSAYWLDFDTAKAPYAAGYNHQIVSLNWGGKRDYATFFSAEPRAMLGILLLPMSPTTQYMSQYGERITAQLKEARVGAPAGQFDDYLLMYESLFGTTDQLTRAKQLPDMAIDDANSRSYLYAWIMTRE